MKEGMPARLRHVAYAAGWKKFEPLWDWLIRAKRVSTMRPTLESVLAGLDQSGRQSSVTEGSALIRPRKSGPS